MLTLVFFSFSFGVLRFVRLSLPYFGIAGAILWFVSILFEVLRAFVLVPLTFRSVVQLFVLVVWISCFVCHLLAWLKIV